MSHTIPVVEYLRPNSHRQAISVEVPAAYNDRIEILEAKLAELVECGITITAEECGGGQVNVCLDDGDFDYKYELYTDDATLTAKVTDLVLAFDPADYRKAKEAFEQGEDMFGGEAHNG